MQDRLSPKYWLTVSTVWAVWYTVIFSFTNNDNIRIFIWGGAAIALVGLLPALSLKFTWDAVPAEALFLGFLSAWGLAGVLVAIESALVIPYVQKLIQFVLLVSAISFLIGSSGFVQPLLYGFIAAAVLNVFLRVTSLDVGFAEATQVLEREAGANAAGFRTVVAMFAILSLYPETRSRFVRAGLLGAAAIVLYGMVLSGSRGAMVGMMMLFFFWFVFCSATLFKGRQITALLILLGIGIVGVLLYDVILENTNLGRRFQDLQRFEDGSTQLRWLLIVRGFEIFLENPIFGVGLGQFGIASGLDMYAHNELAELIATTGLVGTLIYYGAYFTTWRRLRFGVRDTCNPTFHYRANMATAGLLLLIACGSLFRPNFLAQDTMFFYAYLIGLSIWLQSAVASERRVHTALARARQNLARPKRRQVTPRGGVSGRFSS
ncbi:MAG: O-antigen ligase family protein [Pirellulaceae bacterium]|nr:O-antigen ligase family protein [Pirellulaceae bacterium]